MSKSKRKRRRQYLNRKRQAGQSLDFTALEDRRMLSASGSDTNDQICEASTSLLDGSASGTINPNTDVDMYLWNGIAGQRVIFEVEGSAGLDTFLRLFRANGVAVAADDNSGQTAQGTDSALDVTFDVTGDFYFGVSSADNTNYNAIDGTGDTAGAFTATGFFNFTATVVSADPNDEIDEASTTLLDGVSSGNIEPSTDVDLFRWNGIEGQSIRFDVDGSDGLDTLLRVFRDNGQEVGFVDNSGGGTDSALIVTFNDTDDFYIGVSSAGNNTYNVVNGTGDVIGNSKGSYSITATEVSVDPDDQISNAIDLGNLFTDGTVTASGTIDTDADVDLFRFEVGRNDSIVEIDLDTPFLGLNSRLRLFDSVGNEITSDIDTSAPGETVLGLPIESAITQFLNAGVYYVGVSAQDNASYSATTGLGDTDGDSTGSYTIDIQDRLHVDTTDDTNTGAFADNDDKNTLREAISYANIQPFFVPRITFQSSVFPTSGATITLSVGGTNQLEITDSVIIDGLGADRVIVNGNDNSRVFLIDDGDNSTEIDVTIRGLTIRDGNTSASIITDSETGAGIRNSENLTLENVAVRSNRSDPFVADIGENGGGLFHEHGNLLVIGSTFADNSAFNGGGINIESNSAGADIINSTFYNNTVLGGGGGISANGTVTIRNSTITGNRADDDNTISGSRQGGVSFNGGNLTLHNTLVAGNFENTGASEVISDVVALTPDSSNNLIGQQDSSVFGISDGVNGNIVGDGQGGDIPIGSILEQIDTGSGTEFFLTPTSPAINAGNNDEAIDPNGDLDKDQFGNDRVQFGTVDIGSRESSFDIPRETPSLVVTTTSDDVSDVDFETSLREAIMFANVDGDADNDGSPIDTISFDLPVGSTTLITNSALNIASDITIDGFDQIIRANGGSGSHRVFNINDNDAGLSNVTINGLEIRDGGNSSGGNLRGAGIDNSENLTLNDVIISSNNAGTSIGGGIFHDLGALVISNSSVLSNQAVQAGGIWINRGTANITNSTFSENAASFSGGGLIVAANAQATIANSTITGNRADSDGDGSGINGGLFQDNNNTILHNTIVAGNFVGNGTNPSDIAAQTLINGSANNLIGSPSTGSGGLTHDVDGNILGDGNGGIIPIATILDPSLAFNGGTTASHALVEGSPAINAGSNSFANTAGLTTDQRGEARIKFGTVDIGAVESDFDVVVDPFLLGDANLNGVVNFLDIQPFIDILSSNSFLNEADIDRDGDVDFLDIQPFIDILASGGSAESSFALSNSIASAISSESVVTPQPLVAESPVVSAASVVSVAQPVSIALVAQPVAESSQLPTVDVTFAAEAPVETNSGPVTFTPVDYSSLNDRTSSLRDSQSERPFVKRRSLAENTDRPDFAHESRNQRRLASDSVERSFSTAAELFDADPESMNEVFDSQFEETLVELIE